MRRSRELKPLSSEHQQALLVAFQLKNGLAGHADLAGAPRDLPGLYALARRFGDGVLAPHIKAEEELLGRHLPEEALRRMQSEHGELQDLLKGSRSGDPKQQRAALIAFADLLERHVRWEERDVFDQFESATEDEVLADIGVELEKRLVLNRNEATSRRRV